MANKKPILSASMMCANYLELGKEVENLDAAGIDLYHMDIMDGTFVNNFAMSNLEMKAINKVSKTPLDIHLMIENPRNYIADFAQYNPEYISVHYETDRHIHGTLMEIKKHNVKTGVAINPGTSHKVLEPILDLVDMVLVMSVNPGFAGQKFIPSSVEKVRQTRVWLDELGYKDIVIEVDGNINPETATQLAEAGADIFVLGTSGLFMNDMNYKKHIDAIQTSIANLK